MVFPFLLLLWGCQSKSLAEKYYDIELQASKGDVLEYLGSPRFSKRRDGKDSWFYDLRPNFKSSRRVLIFKDGRLTYKGPILPPPLTAEEEDELKERRQPPSVSKTYKRRHSDKELRSIIKDQLKKHPKKKRVPKFEKL